MSEFIIVVKNLKDPYCIFLTKWKLVFSLFFFKQNGSQNQVQVPLKALQSHLLVNKIKQVFELLYEANWMNI